MGQTDILELLENNPHKWFSTKQLSEKLNINQATLIRNAIKLRKNKFVNVRYKYNDKSSRTQIEYKYKNVA